MRFRYRGYLEAPGIIPLSQWRKAAGDDGEVDLFRARRDQIINLKHNLVLLRGKIDRDWFDREIADPLQRQGRAANASQRGVVVLAFQTEKRSAPARAGGHTLVG